MPPSPPNALRYRIHDSMVDNPTNDEAGLTGAGVFDWATQVRFDLYKLVVPPDLDYRDVRYYTTYRHKFLQKRCDVSKIHQKQLLQSSAKEDSGFGLDHWVLQNNGVS